MLSRRLRPFSIESANRAARAPRRPPALVEHALLAAMPPAGALMLLVCFRVAGVAAAGKGARRLARPAEGALPPPLTKGEIRAAYRIMQTQNPFPEEVARRASPLMWAIATALGRATSLHPSCVYVHILLLISTTLGAVQLKYGGILGKHCNLLMLQHGEPGDGKSVALWLDVQILSYYDQVRGEETLIRP